MAKGRNHISVRKDTYDKAKDLQSEYRNLGLNITLEEALYIVKDKEKKDFNDSGWPGGWGI